jgi:DNA-binding LacI/PurR family transcriptional regulator
MADSSTRRVTINDVARRSGVSYQTVSRVINNHPYVAEETRSRVLKVIAELDYRPNKAAKSLVTQRSQTLAVITFGMDYYGPAQMVINIERAAKHEGYDLIFSNIPETSIDNMRAAMNSLDSWLVDGILAITPVTGITCDEMQELCGAIPLVQIDNRMGSATPSVVVDQQYGSRLVTQHLIDLGHTQFAEIGGPQDWFGAAARHQSWLQTLTDAGLQPGPAIHADWTALGGYNAACQLLEYGATFTALVVANDQMALGAIRAVRERGLRIPEDISITGFDDIPESMFFDPPLTTVRQDFDALGRRGVEYLIQRINDPETPSMQHIINPQLITRASTAPPAKA